MPVDDERARGRSELRLFSAGAAQSVATALIPRFTATTGVRIRATFGAVGELRERLLAAEPCDVLVATAAMVDQLAHSGKIVPASIRLLGDVHTGVAVRAGERAPAIGTRAELRASLAAATGICVPDPERATAGVHFLKVLRALGLHDTLAPRLRSYPNGAAAMRALAELPERGLVGCTQVTEITATSGVALVGPLPAPFDLATRYVAATCTGAFDPALAQQWVAMLSGEASRALRRDAGFVQ